MEQGIYDHFRCDLIDLETILDPGCPEKTQTKSPESPKLMQTKKMRTGNAAQNGVFLTISDAICVTSNQF